MEDEEREEKAEIVAIMEAKKTSMQHLLLPPKRLAMANTTFFQPIAETESGRVEVSKTSKTPSVTFFFGAWRKTGVFCSQSKIKDEIQ